MQSHPLRRSMVRVMWSLQARLLTAKVDFDANVYDENGWTPAHVAAARGNAAALRALHQARAKVGLRSLYVQFVLPLVRERF